MNSVTREQRQINGKALLSDAIAAGEEALAQTVVRRLNELLLMAVTYLLGRQSYERRAGLTPWDVMKGNCARCKSHSVRRFNRNLRWLQSFIPFAIGLG
jgi:hypothetical protein